MRNSIPDVAQSSCPAHTEWRILHTAKDLNNTDVQVFQPEVGSGESLQWFYTVTCKNNALRSRRDCVGCCIGMDHNRLLFSSLSTFIGERTRTRVRVAAYENSRR